MFECLRGKSSDTVPTTQTPVYSFCDLVHVSEPPAGGPPVGLRSASVVHVTLERTDMLDETTSDGSKSPIIWIEHNTSNELCIWVRNHVKVRVRVRGSTCDGGGLLMGEGGAFCFHPQPSLRVSTPEQLYLFPSAGCLESESQSLILLSYGVATPASQPASEWERLHGESTAACPGWETPQTNQEGKSQEPPQRTVTDWLTASDAVTLFL